MFLTEICAYLKNYFLHNHEADIHSGEYVIAHGSLESPSFLKDGQYYRIVGSALNDGVHQYGDRTDVLRDETFKGAIWAMSVPPTVVALAAEIANWQNKYGTADSVAMSPYTSETVGSYSVSKGGSGSTNGGAPITWQKVFAARLRPWRKL